MLLEEVPGHMVDVLESIWAEVDASVPASDDYDHICHVQNIKQMKQAISRICFSIVFRVLAQNTTWFCQGNAIGPNIVSGLCYFLVRFQLVQNLFNLETPQ